MLGWCLVDAWLIRWLVIAWILLGRGLILVGFFLNYIFFVLFFCWLTVWLWCQHWIVHLGDHLWPEPKPGCSLGPLEQLGRLLPPPVLPIFHCWALGILHRVDSTCIIRRKVFVEVFIFYFHYFSFHLMCFLWFFALQCDAVWCSARCALSENEQSGAVGWVSVSRSNSEDPGGR